VCIPAGALDSCTQEALAADVCDFVPCDAALCGLGKEPAKACTATGECLCVVSLALSPAAIAALVAGLGVGVAGLALFFYWRCAPARKHRHGHKRV
jgi:hypothetical protein